MVPARFDSTRFSNGQSVKLAFRPEDVSLSTTDVLPPGTCRLSKGVIEEIKFAGAYERLSVRLDLTPKDDAGETPFYLTTETPESQVARPIIATRPKPEAGTVKFNVRDHVLVGLTSFTVLPGTN